MAYDCKIGLVRRRLGLGPTTASGAQAVSWLPLSPQHSKINKALEHIQAAQELLYEAAISIPLDSRSPQDAQLREFIKSQFEAIARTKKPLRAELDRVRVWI
jgi:hypothetical protein